jgi:ABC-type Fe3+/spermidine/putrescine transport system ATPase subunit
VTRPPNLKVATGLQVVLRPDALDLLSPEADGAWTGEVRNRRFAGGNAVYRVKMADNVVMEVESRKMDAREGERVGVGVSREPVPVVEAEAE